MSPVLHEDLHLVGRPQWSRGTTAESEHGINVRANIDVSLSNQIPPSTALRHCRAVYGRDLTRTLRIRQERVHKDIYVFLTYWTIARTHD